MLRKISNIILGLLLLITTGGFNISRHYCGSRLVSVSVDGKAKSCCDDEKGNCCHNESKYFQLKEDFISSIFSFNLENTFSPVELALIPNFISEINYRGENTNEIKLIAGSLPPPKIQSALAQLQEYLL